jgi:MFS family permease
MPTSKDVENGPPQNRGGYSAADIERLGRERPAVFTSIWMELGFCTALLGSMFVAEYLISGFNILLPSLTLALDIPKQAETWPASVFSLVTGAFLLPAGRLADRYGGYIVFSSGLIWLLVWTVVAGCSQNYIMLIFCRALQGFGPAAFLPSGIMLLGSIVSFRPNPNDLKGIHANMP